MGADDVYARDGFTRGVRACSARRFNVRGPLGLTLLSGLIAKRKGHAGGGPPPGGGAHEEAAWEGVELAWSRAAVRGLLHWLVWGYASCFVSSLTFGKSATGLLSHVRR